MEYTKEMLASAEKVGRARQYNMSHMPARLTAQEKQALLEGYHPDYRSDGFTQLHVGANKGSRVPVELAALLEGFPRVDAVPEKTLACDVLVIGGGGAGASCAIEACRAGADVLLVTKLRLGDANTMMAEGGIQAAVKPGDSPATHYLDAIGGGHFAGVPELVRKLVADGPDALGWLCDLGAEFDREPSGEMLTVHGGGTSRKRMHAAKDATGAEIMRTLRDEVLSLPIRVVDFTSALELLTDENGACCGAVLMNMETRELMTVRAGCVVLATGGAGRVHYRGFPTSNHYGATADGLVLGYRAGCRLLYPDTLQYHPTGAAYPPQILGALVTEKVRSMGAMLVNCDGTAFLHPLETRDVTAAAIIRECERGGVRLPQGKAVWLDTPMIDLKHGEGTLEKTLPMMLGMFLQYGIDMRKTPIPVYPTLHYQNGGLAINEKTETDVPCLLAAGEVTGGVHGRNRLMGNSLLDVIVFGREAGRQAAALAKTAVHGQATLAHTARYAKELASCGIGGGALSPMLLPDYSGKGMFK